MECKNCGVPLIETNNYCAACGAKVIRNRLTIKNLRHDFSERFLNLDNTFLKTFLHLFTKPEVVISGYINGVRKKYINPVSYLGIALTLSGFLVFLMKKQADQIDFDIFGTGLQSSKMQPIFDFTTDFQAILFVLYIPMMAMAGWLAYDKKAYNFSERLTLFMYTLSHYSIVVFLPSIFVLAVFPQFYAQLSFSFLGLMYLFSAYIIKRTSELGGVDFIARILIFFVLFSLQYFAMIIIIPIILLLTGELSFQDIAPPK